MFLREDSLYSFILSSNYYNQNGGNPLYIYRAPIIKMDFFNLYKDLFQVDPTEQVLSMWWFLEKL